MKLSQIKHKYESALLLSGSKMQPENIYSCILKVIGQVWESQKKKKGKASTLITATTSVHLPKPVSTDQQSSQIQF